MRKYFQRVENNHYLARGTPGHGFDGYLDISINTPETLTNQSGVLTVLAQAAKLMGQDPSKIVELAQVDLNNEDEDRDQQTGISSFPGHRDLLGRRSSARNPVVAVAGATDPDGSKKYPLTVSLNSFATKVLFDEKKGKHPRAIGVEFLVGKSLYSADPRYNAKDTGTKKRVYARKEVVVSGGTFNSPQLLKLSGIGPMTELAKFNIPLVVDLPRVGTNLQDNYEIGVIARASTDLPNKSPACTFGFGGGPDPCLEAWQHGTGPYATGPLDALMFKTSKAAYGERDLFLWGNPGAFRGFWPSDTVNQLPFDPPSTIGFSMAKMHPQNRLGTVILRSSDPRDTPDINFRFFDENGDADLAAMAEGVEFGRRVFHSLAAPLAPFTETDPCDGLRTCDVKEHIRTQAWSHHATSTCAIGADKDPLAVLDSKFRVRGTVGLRVVDASAFPRIPGGFPVLPTFILSEKAAESILEDA
jgi:choline dehydrogenase